MKTCVYLTIDTETSMGGAWRFPDREPLPVEKRIFCESDGQSWGLPLMVDELHRYGFRATFFVEVFAALCLGEGPIRRVFDYLLRTGQDIQLHNHPTFRNYALGRNGGDRQRFEHYRKLSDAMHHYSREEQRAMLQEAAALFQRFAGYPPAAYRAGGFRANFDTLAALPAGIVIDSSFNPGDPCSFPATRLQINRAQRIGDVIELPVTVGLSGPWPFRGWKHLEISALTLMELEKALLEGHSHGLRHCVIVFHSFSIVKHKDIFYSKIRPDRLVIARYRGLLRFLAAHHERFEVRTMGDAAGCPNLLADVHARQPDAAPVPGLGTLLPMWRKGVQAVNRLYWV